MRAAPTPEDVALYIIGDAFDAEASEEVSAAAARLPLVVAFAQSYTRGVGWSQDATQCDPALWAVCVACCAREVANLPGVRREQIGEYSALLDDTSGAWSLREMLVLNDFRRRAA